MGSGDLLKEALEKAVDAAIQRAHQKIRDGSIGYDYSQAQPERNEMSDFKVGDMVRIRPREVDNAIIRGTTYTAQMAALEGKVYPILETLSNERFVLAIPGNNSWAWQSVWLELVSNAALPSPYPGQVWNTKGEGFRIITDVSEDRTQATSVGLKGGWGWVDTYKSWASLPNPKGCGWHHQFSDGVPQEGGRWLTTPATLAETIAFRKEIGWLGAIQETLLSKKDGQNKKPETAIETILYDYQKERQPGVHYLFEVVMTILRAGVNLFIVGPAGSGKTHAVEQAAEALGRDFYCQSVGGQTTMTHLLGYMNATGQYVSTAFRDAFEKGGVFLLDEMDAGNANVLTCLNAALSNNVCSFPDGMISKHKDFICVAAGNTFGIGSNRQYVGRNPLDAASLDRFAFLEWPYDEEMETELTESVQWARRVQSIRWSLDQLKVQHIVSPRATLSGAKLLDAGLPQALVEELVIWKGMKQDMQEKAKQQAKSAPEPSPEEEKEKNEKKQKKSKQKAEKEGRQPLEKKDEPQKIKLNGFTSSTEADREATNLIKEKVETADVLGDLRRL